MYIEGIWLQTLLHVLEDHIKPKSWLHLYDNHSLCLCVIDLCSTVEHIYCSKDTGITSHIGHFVLSENAINMILTYTIHWRQQIFVLNL